MAAVEGIGPDLTQSVRKFNVLQLCTECKRALADLCDRRRKENAADFRHGKSFICNFSYIFWYGECFVLFADAEPLQRTDALIFQQNAIFNFESHSRAS